MLCAAMVNGPWSTVNGQRPMVNGSAQEQREVYVQAENDYQIGRIEQARDLLLQNLNSFQGNLRQNALRLIALSYLARFDIEQTEHYATLLLEENPYYTATSQDPPEFADIVNDIKAGMTATITTASSQAESLAEVPVPTTLITAEMIQNSGARNLQEVLAAYVPGMNIIDCDDDINIAMRGIYSNTQEKILIMLNGHRLNSYATNTAAPDFSISLEKVKQIEVLRGPASSLYGGVALTAVVNIITKQGADVDGLEAKAAAGNHGQVRADALFGKRYFDIDLLLWGSVYRNSGEKYDVTNERLDERREYDTEDSGQFDMAVDNIRIGRIGQRPTYDFGLQLGYKGMLFMYDSHFSQVVAPFTMTALALSYDHDRYRTYNGISPSFATYSRHADLSYQNTLFDVQWKVSATYDKTDVTRYQVINDNPMPTLGIALELADVVSDIYAENGGISRYVNGQEQDYGLQLKGNYAYSLGDSHRGNIGIGAEYAHFQLDDIRYQVGYNFVETINETPKMRDAGTGSENSVNAYLQLKHHWDFSLFNRPSSLIMNAGLRYDYKTRYDDSRVRELSPRVALILLRPKWNVKLSYSKSFVDAPYIYRKANVLSKMMSDIQTGQPDELSPERVHSLQLSFAGTNWVKGLIFEVNGFYNSASDLIMTRILEYKNASKNKTGGVELMANGQWPMANGQHFTTDFNLTWTKTFKSNLVSYVVVSEEEGALSSNIDTNNNTPAIMSNLVIGWQPTKRLKLHTHVLFEGKQTSYNTDLVKLIQGINALSKAVKYALEGNQEATDKAEEECLDAFSKVIMRKEMPARAILNLGGEYLLGSSVTLGLNVNNLLGTCYYRSGMNTNLIPQQGRWFLASIGVKF